MTQPQRPFPLDTDDTEGHRVTPTGADAERAEGDGDAEGHGACTNRAEAELAEGDDEAEGHAMKGHADGERAEGDDDTEGHGATRYALGSAAATLAVSASRAR